MSFRVEELTNFVAGHLLRARPPFADEEFAAEGVGLALLGGDSHTQHLADAFDLHRDGRFSGTGDGLDFGLQTVVISYSRNLPPIVRDTDQDYSSGGIGKGADLTTEAGCLDFLNSVV